MLLCERMEPEEVPYGPWFESHKPTEKELEAQRKKQWKKQPLISVVVPAYKTPEKFLREMIKSLEAQTYTNWELVLVDASDADKRLERRLPKTVPGTIVYEPIENGGIALKRKKHYG